MADHEVLTLGGGCFWCLEAVYRETQGVVSAVSGYMGGASANPTYKQVCSGTTGHVEVVQVTFDPAVISARDVLEIFFVIHDPTTLNSQGNDCMGRSARSVIFYHSPEQKTLAEEMIAELTREKDVRSTDRVTAVEPVSTFYPAEDYHQDYFANNPYQPYCSYVVGPKVEKFPEEVCGKTARSDLGSALPAFGNHEPRPRLDSRSNPFEARFPHQTFDWRKRGGFQACGDSKKEVHGSNPELCVNSPPAYQSGDRKFRDKPLAFGG